MEESHSDIGITGGVFPFAKINGKGERLTRSAVCTSSPLRSLRPCCTAFLTILRGLSRRHHGVSRIVRPSGRFCHC